MKKKLRILRTKVTNPWFNLATENWILHDLDPDTFTLYLWRNDNAVVIGRYQNPWVECKVEKMEADGVCLARRESGGGAVYHDLGNSNFTFLSSKENYRQGDNFSIIVNALAKLGIEAAKSGRNDVVVEEKKISGSAFRQTATRCFHHGTLLIDADITKLGDYLSPNRLKLESKGIKSVRSRVANLVDFVSGLDHEKVCEAIIESFCDFHGEKVEVEWLDEETLKQIQSLDEHYQKLSDWQWRFGRTPDFSHQMETRFEWGMIALHLDVEKAHVQKCKIFSDALDTSLVELLEKKLVGMLYNSQGVSEHLTALAQAEPSYQKELEQIAQWIAEEIGDD